MNFLKNLINQNAYSLNLDQKYQYLKKNLNFLTSFHYKKSRFYKNYLKGINYNIKKYNDINEIPFLPVRLFKEFDFLSIKRKNIYKTLLSSGTTSNILSKIYLDKDNALNQIKVLQKIFYNLIGNSRLPMLVIDRQNKGIDRYKFNASTAAINGFSIFANEIIYLLDENYNINYKKLYKFLKKNKKNKFMIFGFTSNIYLYFIKKLNNKKQFKNAFVNSLLIHGGGWKKIEEKVPVCTVAPSCTD